VNKEIKLKMKTRKAITLWDRINNCIEDLEPDEPKELVTDLDVVERLIELAYHYRLECKKLQEQLDEYEWNNKINNL
jgi:septation ring formation regulator EzrA